MSDPTDRNPMYGLMKAENLFRRQAGIYRQAGKQVYAEAALQDAKAVELLAKMIEDGASGQFLEAFADEYHD